MYTSSALENKIIPQPSSLIPKLSTTSHMDKKDPKLLQVHKNKVLKKHILRFQAWSHHSFKRSPVSLFPSNPKDNWGISFHTYLCLALVNEPHQSRRESLMKWGRTQETPNKENITIHKPAVHVQWTMMWSVDSFASLQTKHLFTKLHKNYYRKE